MASSVFNKIPTIGSATLITLPYTAPSDGFVHLRLNPSTTSGGSASISANGITASVNTTTGSAQSTLIPVKKGDSVIHRASTHSYEVYFIPLA